MTKSLETKDITVLPLTPERWNDLEALFGPNGACAGCWCMWYRMTNAEFKKSRVEGHKNGIQALVQSGAEPGLIAYADGIPAGWVTIAPREEYVRLETSKVMAAVDDAPVWSIPCFFIHRNFRRMGLMAKLIHAAVAHAQGKGAKIIEAYPVEPTEKMNATSLFPGLATIFRGEGFVEVARPSETRLIMRKEL